jgi:GxxExxY protein
MDDRDPQTFAILGAAFDVHRCLGGGYLEPVYRSATTIEFGLRAIQFVAEPDLVVRYKSHMVGRFRPDFVCYGDIVVEVKAHPLIAGSDIAQTLNYLKASGASRALLLNFGTQRLEYKRLVGPAWRLRE